jgi:hypothetical protein
LTSSCPASRWGGITSRCLSRIFQGAVNSSTTRISHIYAQNRPSPHDTIQSLWAFSFHVRNNIDTAS